MTYETQNFTCKTSVGLYSITKGISEIYLLEREHVISYGSLKSPISSQIFIHSMMHEIEKKVPLIVCGFQKSSFHGFISEMWESFSFS